MTNSQLPFQQ